MHFEPVIFETHGGGWAGGAAALVRFIAQGQKARGLWTTEGLATRTAQRLSISLCRESARAVHERVAAIRRVAVARPPVVITGEDADDDFSDVEQDVMREL